MAQAFLIDAVADAGGEVPFNRHFERCERIRRLKQRIDRDAVVVTHAGVIRTALAHWLAMPDEALFRIDQGHGAVSVVDWLEGTPVVRRVNCPPGDAILGAWRARRS